MIALLARETWVVGLMPTDTAQYVSGARNLARGNGFSTSALYLQEHHRLGDPAPLTAWPPGYSILLAAAHIATGLPPEYLAFWVSMILYLCVPPLLFALDRAGGGSSRSALLVAMTWLIMPLTFQNALEGMSDSAFMATILASFYCYFVGSKERSRRSTWIFMAGLLAAVALSVRFVGLAAAVTLCICEAIRAIGKRDRRSWASLFLLAMPVMFVATAILTRNWVVTGSVRGGDVLPPLATDSNVLKLFYWALADLVGSDALGGAAGAALLVLVALVGTLGFVSIRTCARVFRRMLSNGREFLSSPIQGVNNTAVALYAVYGSAILALHVYAALHNAADAPNARYLATIVPIVALYLAAVQRSSPEGDSVRFSAKLNQRLLFALVLAFALMQLSSIPGHVVYLQSATGIAVDKALRERIDGSDIGAYLAEQVGPGEAVLDIEGQLLNLQLDRTTVGLTPYPYTVRQWTDREVLDLVKRTNAKFVTVISGATESRVRIGQGLPFYRDLLDQKVPDWLVEVHRGPAITLYRVKRSDFETE
jgi:4-amino-4-deoxy-L-arabinose transferase-like glycosyltransferase